MPPSPRQPLPRWLDSTAFTVEQGLSAGLGQSRMRGRDLAKPFHGVRLSQTLDSIGRPTDPAPHSRPAHADLTRLCTALAVALPDGASFSHLTAARLWPLPVPLPLPEASRSEPLHVSVRPPHRPPRRSGVVGHQATDRLASVVNRNGLLLIDPATLFCQLGTMLSLHDLVAVGDAVVLQPVVGDPCDHRPWVPLPQLLERVEMFRGRGKKAAARAALLIREGAESRPETLLRLAIMDAGLPEPEVNADVFDSRGRFIGSGDLVYRKWRVIAEYDGDHHRTDTKQYDKDVRRLESFARNGWRMVRITGRSFFPHRAAAAARVARALQDASWQPSAGPTAAKPPIDSPNSDPPSQRNVQYR